MGFNTRAFKAQDLLVGALQNSAALTDWTIDYGLPSRRQSLHIWVDENVDQWQQEPGTTGLISRNETFHLNIYIYSKRTNATAEEVRNEIVEAGDVVADIIGTEPFLGGAVLYAQVVGGEYGGAFADAEGRIREGYLKLVVAVDSFVA